MTAIAVHVIGVSGDAEAVAERLADAGHTVSGPVAVGLAGLTDALAGAPGADVCVIVGGVGARGGVPEAIGATIGQPLPGFGELLRALIFAEHGARAIDVRAFAGISNGRVVFAIPEEPAFATLALERLILPDLARWSTDAEEVAPAPARAATPSPAPASGGPARAIGLSATEVRGEGPPGVAESTEIPPGWRSAVAALGGELLIGRHEDLPEPIENFAPVVNLLQQAGEVGTLKLPSGKRYAVFGWPDLRRDGAKVLAVGWGDPLAEVVALHRHPREAGTCVVGGSPLLPGTNDPLDAVAVRFTGRAPPDPEGELFAVQDGCVWILRGRRVFQWDGSREKDDGSPKQVLASLTLHWSNR